MRVLMFGWEYPPYRAGGLATATRGLVAGLLRRGVAVTLVVPFPLPSGWERERKGLRRVSASGRHRPRYGAGVRVRRVPSLLSPYLTEATYRALRDREAGKEMALAGPLGRLYGPGLREEVERLAAVAAAIALQEPHDLLDAHDWMTYPAAMRAARASGRPWVAHLHATEYDRSGPFPDPEIVRREREGLHDAALVIVNSRRMRAQLVERYGLPADKIVVIPWGIEPDRPEYRLPVRPPFPPEAPVVLFLGRITHQKGPGYFLETAARLVRYVPEARFIVAGGGDLLPWAIERAAELGLAERVFFTGPLQGEEVFRVLRLADVCVMPSVSEPFGLVALESVKSGTPCLVSRDAGVAEVLHHVLKVDFWDIDEMTNQLVALLRHRPLREELAEQGTRETAAPRFGLDEPARLTHEAYLRVLKGTGGALPEKQQQEEGERNAP